MRKKSNIVWVIAMTVLSLIMLIPIIMMFLSSFKSLDEIKSSVFHLFPKEFSLKNYKDALASGMWYKFFLNSTVITVAAVVFSLLFNSIAGYAFARLKFRGRKVLFLFLMIGLMMPPQVTMLPTFLIMAKLPLVGGNNIFGLGGQGLIDTYLGLIIPLVSGSYGVFLCKQFYESIPNSFDEAATIDGAGKWRTFFMIYVPNSKTILATLGLLKAVSVWNDYMWPLVMIKSENMKTVQLALSMFKTEGGIEWGQMLATSVMVAMPMLVIFLITQKYFINGIVTSGLK